MKDNEQNLLIGGDYNARMGQEETIIWEDDRDEIWRRSKDRIINIEGKRLLEEEKGWNIWNGNTKEDEEEELTSIDTRRSSVIDYAIENTKARDKVDSLVIKERMELNHLLICVYIQAKNLRQPLLQKEKDFKERNFKQIWTEEGIKNFREILETQKFEKTGLEES